MGHPEPFDLRYVAIGNEDCGKKNYRGLHISLIHSFCLLLFILVQNVGFVIGDNIICLFLSSILEASRSDFISFPSTFDLLIPFTFSI